MLKQYLSEFMERFEYLQEDRIVIEKAFDVLDYCVKIDLFADILNEWKNNMDIVINEEMYNSYEKYEPVYQDGLLAFGGILCGL